MYQIAPKLLWRVPYLQVDCSKILQKLILPFQYRSQVLRGHQKEVPIGDGTEILKLFEKESWFERCIYSDPWNRVVFHGIQEPRKSVWLWAKDQDVRMDHLPSVQESKLQSFHFTVHPFCWVLCAEVDKHVYSACSREKQHDFWWRLCFIQHYKEDQQKLVQAG